MVWAICALVAGLVLLWKCADYLVLGAVTVARRLGLSPFIIGLTIVAMGTSAPEVAASIAAVLEPGGGGGDIAIGNICGSNIANLALVGGIVAIIRPLCIQSAILRREIPIMVGVGLLLGALLWDGSLARVEALFILLLFAGFLICIILVGRRNAVPPWLVDSDPSDSDFPRKPIWDYALIVGGLLGLALGAKLAITGATTIGYALGLSKAVIGLTIVSIGTSLPELITCVVAAFRGHDDLSVGNLVGSNIFNTLLVTGAAGLCRPFEISARFAGGSDYWVMMGVSIGFVLVSLIGRGKINRITGFLLFGAYVVYLSYLFYNPIGA